MWGQISLVLTKQLLSSAGFKEISPVKGQTGELDLNASVWEV